MTRGSAKTCGHVAKWNVCCIAKAFRDLIEVSGPVCLAHHEVVHADLYVRISRSFSCSGISRDQRSGIFFSLLYVMTCSSSSFALHYQRAMLCLGKIAGDSYIIEAVRIVMGLVGRKVGRYCV